jgi:hypothetical protein
MKACNYLACLLILLLNTACDRDSARRLAYGTVQNMGQQRCMDGSPSNQWGDCMKAPSYDEYQRERREVEKSQNDAPPN